MKQKFLMMRAFVLGMAALSMASCGIDMPKEVETSFETLTVEKQDITVPMKFSAKLKGQTDVTITPQVNGQLMKICVSEGQQVKKGQTLFAIDSRNALLDLEAAQANMEAALAAFFPSITLSGTIGWTNSGGGAVLNPGSLLLNVMGQLTQPIFSRGKLKANLKVNQLNVEDMQKKYVQTIVNAGNQVNEALADCQAAREKHGYYHRQVEVLHKAYTGTHELMDNGKASYLEVFTAQESLLSSQLSEAMNMYNGAQAVIALYIALGGGTK